MANFTNEHKKEQTGNYFGEGIHKVQISEVVFDKESDGREYAEITVVDPDNGERTDKARLWFHTDGAIGYSFNIFKGIFVHNAPEGKKDETRAALDAMNGTDDLEKACKVLKGKEAWYQVAKSPTRTYTDKAGNTKPSFDKNITGYEPTPKTVTVAPGVEGTPESDSNLPAGF